jgi:redox-sensitive bicupin YhaK (pirin superfamily)
MFKIRRAAERGHANHGWLDSFHTFSFANYYDPQQLGFRALRVINEDVIAPTQGFGMHGHRDMEIVTLVLSGTLEHKDSLGHGQQLRPGEIQHMSAGTGIRHSEFNPAEQQPVHLYQIWIMPQQPSLTPRYGQRAFDAAQRVNRWQLVASLDGRDDSLPIQTDAAIYLANLEAGGKVNYEFAAERYGWLQVLSGTVQMASDTLLAGDGLAVSNEPQLALSTPEKAEVMLFDLA